MIIMWWFFFLWFKDKSEIERHKLLLNCCTCEFQKIEDYMYVFKSLRVEYFESNQKQIFKNSDVTLLKIIL